MFCSMLSLGVVDRPGQPIALFSGMKTITIDNFPCDAVPAFDNEGTGVIHIQGLAFIHPVMGLNPDFGADGGGPSLPLADDPGWINVGNPGFKQIQEPGQDLFSGNRFSQGCFQGNGLVFI